MTKYYYWRSESEHTTGQIANLALHAAARPTPERPFSVRLPTVWYSASKRARVPLRDMSTPHLVHSLSLLLRSEGRINPNQGLGMRRALLCELAKRAPSATGITYVGPQALAVDYYS